MNNTFIPLAYNFWNVVQLLTEQMEQSGNKIIIFSDYNKDETEEKNERKINKIFKRNDNNIGVPIMFNFYHGLELFMKGLLELENIPLENEKHNLEDLYKKIKANKEKYSSSLIELLKKHISNKKSFNPFFETNNIKVNDFYIGLKYPQNIRGDKHYKYSTIRGKEEETLKIYQAMRNATLDFREQIVNWRKTKQ